MAAAGAQDSVGLDDKAEEQLQVLHAMEDLRAIDNAKMEQLLDEGENDFGSGVTDESESFGVHSEDCDDTALKVYFSVGDLTSEQRSRVWYRRMGMPSLKALQRASKEKSVIGLQVSSRLAVDDDPTVVEARFKSATYKSKADGMDASKLPILHTMSVDEVSGFPCITIGGATSAFIAVCHRSNLMFAFLVKGRGEFPDVLAALMADIAARGDYELKRVWSDSAPEIQAGRAREIADSMGIKLEPTGVHCPQAGGKHESAVQLVCHRTRAMMLLAPWMPPNTWGLAMLYAVHVINLTVSEIHGEFKSPSERVTGRVPDLRHRCVHVWGCKLSYGLTKQERMATTAKKMSALTRSYLFAGIIGNMVIMRDGKTGKLFQGNRQKCHFYEGIFAMRNPPKQLNPLALLEEERDEYIASLRRHGLVADSDRASTGSEDADIEVVRSINNLKPVSEVYDAIRANFADLESGGEKIFDLDATMETVGSEQSGRQVRPFVLHDPESVTEQPTRPEVHSEKSEVEDEPVAKRVRFSNSSKKPIVNSLSESEVKQKLAEYPDELHHPSDGSTAKVIHASKRKRKGSDKYDWWLKLQWDCGLVKHYQETAMRQALGLGADSLKEGTGASAKLRRSTRTRASKDRAATCQLMVQMHNCLAATLVSDAEWQSDDDEEVHSVFAAVQERVTALWPTPKKEWPDPKNAYECIAADDWRGWIWAAQMERQSWLEQAVFKIIKKVDRERGRNTYPLNDIWKRKWHAADGAFDKHKCRLVVLGNLFRRGKDCSSNTWAPTASATTVRVFLNVSVQSSYPIWIFDIRTAFLLAIADGKYYCFYPALFKLAEMSEEELQECRRIVTSGTEKEQQDLKRQLCGKYSKDDDRVLEILKSVYGSPSAPRSFYLHFREILRSMGWIPTQSEPCLFQKRVRGHVMRIVLHVDDGAVSGPTLFLEEFVKELQTKVRITFRKCVNEFTGLGIDYNVEKGELRVHLKSYITDAMQRFKQYVPKAMYASKTPLPTGTVFSPATDEEHQAAKQLPYQELIGCLVWVSVQVKIQAATSVSMLGSHAAKWNAKHFNAALKVLLWMDTNKNEGLLIKRDRNFDPSNCIWAYADADLAGDPATRRSRSGMVIMMGCSTSATCISHRSSLQKTIALSTTAAEIVSLIEAATPIEGLRFLLAEMFLKQTSPTVVYEDNQPCIAVTSDAAKPVGEHTKFYDMRIKKLKEMQSLGIIKVTYCRTAQMLADLFTKNVNSVIFERIAGVITGEGCTRQALALLLSLLE